ncbi:MAG: hypothetical protein IJ303_00810 [Clostridia bacterium]|nr:hypothetical protein [Clostridia bacterium]
MNYNACCAAKDYLRQIHCTTEDLIYETEKLQRNESIGESFVAYVKACHRAAISLSEELLVYSGFTPARDIAREVIRDHRSRIKAINARSLRPYKNDTDPDVLNEYLEQHFIIKQRMLDEMRSAEISERINCDYIRHILPIEEGCLREAENALRLGLSRNLSQIAKDIIANSKPLVGTMHKLSGMICR